MSSLSTAAGAEHCVPSLGTEDVANAIAAAVTAQRAWLKEPGKARAITLRNWYDRVIAAIDDLALPNTLEQGKPLAEARAEVLYAASFIEWFAEVPSTGFRIDPLEGLQNVMTYLHGEIVALDGPGR